MEHLPNAVVASDFRVVGYDHELNQFSKNAVDGLTPENITDDTVAIGFLDQAVLSVDQTQHAASEDKLDDSGLKAEDIINLSAGSHVIAGEKSPKPIETDAFDELLARSVGSNALKLYKLELEQFNEDPQPQELLTTDSSVKTIESGLQPMDTNEKNDKLRSRVRDACRALDMSFTNGTLNNTAHDIVDFARKNLEGDEQLAMTAMAVGGSDNAGFVGDVFQKVLRNGVNDAFGEHAEPVLKRLVNFLKGHGDALSSPSDQVRIESRQRLAGAAVKIARTTEMGQGLESLSEEQIRSYQRLFLGFATGVSTPDQRPNVHKLLDSSLS